MKTGKPARLLLTGKLRTNKLFARQPPLTGEPAPPYEMPGTAAPLVWLAGVIVLIAASFGGFAGYSHAVNARAEQIVGAANAELTPWIRQHRVPRALAIAAARMIASPEFGLDYLTLRNAAGVTLLSQGRFESFASSLPTAPARRMRRIVYGLFSANRGIALHRAGHTVGYMDFGVDVTAAIRSVWPLLVLCLLLWLAAAYAVVRLMPEAVAALKRGPDADNAPVAPRPRIKPVSPRPAAAVRTDHGPATPLSADAAVRLAEQLHLGLIGSDADGRIVQINTVAQRLLPAARTGSTVADALALADGENRKMEAPLQRALRGGPGPVRDRAWLQRPGQSPLGLELVAAVSADGDAPAASMLFWEADTAMRVQSRLAERAALAEAVLTHAGDPVAIVDPAGRIRRVNPAWSQLFAESADRLQGIALSKLLGPSFAGNRLAVANGLPAQATPGDIELPVTVDLVACQWQGEVAFVAVIHRV